MQLFQTRPILRSFFRMFALTIMRRMFEEDGKEGAVEVDFWLELAST
jgi:hypothetical protein